TFAAEITFHLQGGELVRDDPYRPIGHIRFGGLRTVGHDFLRGEPFLPRAERAERSRDRPDRLHLREVVRSAVPLSRNDLPATYDGVAPQVRHSVPKKCAKQFIPSRPSLRIPV